MRENTHLEVDAVQRATPPAAVYPTLQPIPGAQPTCAHAHTHQGRSEFLASRGQLRPKPGSGRALSSAQGSASLGPSLWLCSGTICSARAWGAAHLCSCSTLLLKDEHPPAGLPFDAARSPDATRGATPARTRMASATCLGPTLDGPRLPILGCILANCGAARGEDSLLQSPAECGRMHAPVDSETDLTLAV